MSPFVDWPRRLFPTRQALHFRTHDLPGGPPGAVQVDLRGQVAIRGVRSGFSRAASIDMCMDRVCRQEQPSFWIQIRIEQRHGKMNDSRRDPPVHW